ncbi:hypothetical protein D3C75_1027580 [compost metagenome]
MRVSAGYRILARLGILHVHNGKGREFGNPEGQAIHIFLVAHDLGFNQYTFSVTMLNKYRQLRQEFLPFLRINRNGGLQQGKGNGDRTAGHVRFDGHRAAHYYNAAVTQCFPDHFFLLCPFFYLFALLFLLNRDDVEIYIPIEPLKRIVRNRDHAVVCVQLQS